jgi:hypothetical protein
LYPFLKATILCFQRNIEDATENVKNRPSFSPSYSLSNEITFRQTQTGATILLELLLSLAQEAET